MEPGTLCPKHYAAWRSSGWEEFLIFHLSTDGDLVAKNYERDHRVRVQIEKARAQAIQYSSTMDEAKEDALIEALELTCYNIAQSMRLLGISKATMYRMIKRYGIKIIRQNADRS